VVLVAVLAALAVTACAQHNHTLVRSSFRVLRLRRGCWLLLLLAAARRSNAGTAWLLQRLLLLLLLLAAARCSNVGTA
jgi:hypothetical protein